jgi:basic membrane protein A and related proteins
MKPFLAIFCCLSFFAAEVRSEPLKIALILDKGGKDDKSFNAAAFAGAEKAKKELGIELKYVEAMDDAAVTSMMRSFAQKKFDLIIGVGFSMADGIKKVATQFPDLKFALVDSEIVLPNVKNLLFEEHQGSFLVGAAAALHSKTGKVGFLGGMDVPLIRRFQMGFEAGVKHINSKAEVVNNYVGVTSDAWNNPAKAKELSLSQFNKGVDVIFAAAGASNYGLFDAAEEKKKLAIGVDSNQNWVKPGIVLTSMLKRVDVAVFETIKSAKENKFSGGTERFGLANKGVDYSVDQFNEKVLSSETRKKLEEVKKLIISGKILVPDYYKNAKQK